VLAACAYAITITITITITIIIGIPFVLLHLKLAAISLAPVGKRIMKKHLAEAARIQSAHAEPGRIRRQN
jgi:uncharacterized membrane protein YccF (DUF307 family)